jgi:transcriptional repressor NrdR
MDALRGLDDVAYVRFASVYRSFQDLNEFQAEIQRMQDAEDAAAAAADKTPEPTAG